MARHRRPPHPPAAKRPRPRRPSAAAVDAGAQQLDSKFEKMAAWSVVKREFPDWYGEQLRQAAELSAQNQPEHEVNKHLAEALVALRRQHANEALSASTERLKGWQRASSTISRRSPARASAPATGSSRRARPRQR